MGKYWKKTNLVTIYVRPKYHPLLDEFIKQCNKDEILKKKADEKNVGAKGMLSIGIMKLIYSDVRKRNPSFKLTEIEDESKEEIKQEVPDEISIENNN